MLVSRCAKDSENERKRLDIRMIVRKAIRRERGSRNRIKDENRRS